MGLNASILKHNGRSFAGIGGLSTYYEDVCIVNIDGPFSPNPRTHPPVILVEGNVHGSVKAVAVKDDGEGGWVRLRPENSVGPMHGGCFIESSDSRFGAAVEALGGPRYAPVALHDRFESPELYAALSA